MNANGKQAKSSGDLVVPRVVVHMGYQRTGTTMHQQHIFPKLKGVSFLGKPFPEQAAQLAFRELACRDSANYDAEETKRILLGCVASARNEGARCMLISNEVMMATDSVDTRLLVERLRNVFGDFQALLTIRDQFDLFRSWCYHVLRKRTYPSLNSIIEENAEIRGTQRTLVSLLDYDRYYRFLGGLIGEENVLLLPFELIKHDRARYAELLGRYLGVSEQLVLEQLKVAPRENAKPTPGEAAFIDFRKQYLANKRRSRLDRVGAALFGLLPNSHRGAERKLEEVRARFANEFAPGNTALQAVMLKRTGVDLGELGYAVQ
jgi:hypothetical protein